MSSSNPNNTNSNNMLMLSEVPPIESITSQMNSLFGSYIDSNQSTNARVQATNEKIREMTASLLLPNTD